jgi:dienelactone hydrolase
MVPWGHGPSPYDLSDKIGCPILGLFGDDDPNPSPADVAKISAELTRLGKPHEFHGYAGAGHAFMNESRPTTARKPRRTPGRKQSHSSTVT